MSEDVINNRAKLMKSHTYEYVKSYSEYDNLGRLVRIHQATSIAEDGDPTVITQYAYSGNSSLVTYMKEYEGTWQSVWETF